MIGKWHLGYGQRSQLPRARGFDTYLGYWNGAESYSNHTVGAKAVNGTQLPVYVALEDSTAPRPPVHAEGAV